MHASRSLSLQAVASLLIFVSGFAGAVSASGQTVESVCGRTIDRRGEPLPLVRVFLETDEGELVGQVESDHRGCFEFTSVPAGSFKLFGYLEDHASSRHRSVRASGVGGGGYWLRLTPVEAARHLPAPRGRAPRDTKSRIGPPMAFFLRCDLAPCCPAQGSD